MNGEGRLFDGRGGAIISLKMPKERLFEGGRLFKEGEYFIIHGNRSFAKLYMYLCGLPRYLNI